MTTASNNVQVQVTYRGIDQTQRASKKARKSIRGIGGAASTARAKLTALRGGFSQIVSGDLIGGVNTLSAGLGPRGIAGTAAAAAVGVTAIGAAAAAAAVKITQMTIETNRLVASADAAFGARGGQGLQRALDIAEDVGGIGAENVAKLAGTLRSVGLSANITGAQLRELTGRATTMGKSGDDALQAFARAVESGRTRVLASVGTFVDAGAEVTNYARRLGISADQVSEYEKRQIALKLITDSLNTTQERSTTLYDEQDRALASLSNAFLRLKVNIAEAVGGAAAEAVDTLAEFTNTIADTARGLLALIKFSLIPTRVAFFSLGDGIAAAAAAAITAARGDLAGVKAIFAKHVRDVEAYRVAIVAEVAALPGAFDRAARKIRADVDGITIDAQRSAAAAAAAAAAVKRADALIAKLAAKRAAARAKRRARARRAAAAAASSDIAAQRARIARAAAFGASEAELFDARIALIDREESNATKAAARAVNTARGRENAITAIVVTAETKRLKLRQKLRESEIAGDQSIFDELEADMTKIVALNDNAAKKAAADAKEAAAARAANIADATRQLQTLQTQIGNTGSAVGNVLGALPALGAAVATSFTNSKTAMQDALSVGQSAFVGLADAEAKRSLAGIDNAHRLELATAKTEKERAAITEKFEARRAAAVESAERRKAAILAIMEAAKAIASYPNIPQMAAHGAAAALYAGVAGGVIGGGAAGGASVGAATGTGAAMATTTADAAPTTAAPVVVNFGAGFVFGTHQQVGKSVAGSLKSLRTTGLATAGGV